jgi:hypothetical protein
LPTNFTFAESADHSIGEEATTITIKARYTCKEIAYGCQVLAVERGSFFAYGKPAGKTHEAAF